jgi:Lon protease-like protein
MFPLRGVFLFPGQLLPLHVFEPRYRQMIEDMLDSAGRLVMGTILERQDETTSAEPAVLEIAGLGEIARHERLPDGRFSVLVFGLARVRIEEVGSDRLYRRVRCHPVPELTPAADEEARLREELAAAIQARTGFQIERVTDVSAAQLADVLAQTLMVPQRSMEEIFVECDVARRARRVLAVHAQSPQQRKT